MVSAQGGETYENRHQGRTCGIGETFTSTGGFFLVPIWRFWALQFGIAIGLAPSCLRARKTMSERNSSEDDERQRYAGVAHRS